MRVARPSKEPVWVPVASPARYLLYRLTPLRNRDRSPRLFLAYVANYNALKICQIRKRWQDELSLWSAIFFNEIKLIITPLNVSASTTLYSIERLTHPIIYFLLPVVFWMGSITLFLRVACIELRFWLVLGVCVAGGGSVRFVQGPSPDRGINQKVSSVTSLQ